MHSDNKQQGGHAAAAIIGEALAGVRAAGDDDKSALYEQALQELRIPAILSADDGAFSAPTLFARLGRLIKVLRLNGELPYWLARVAALSLMEGRHTPLTGGDVREALALDKEAEVFYLVTEAAGLLPNLGLDRHSLRRAALMKDAYRRGYRYEQIYRGCAQCAMAAVSDITGKEDSAMFRAANGLAAGMGLMGDGACGGYSGGILTFGMYAGRRKDFFDGDKDEKDKNAALVRRLHDKFTACYGSVICRDVQNTIFGRSFHITEEEDKRAFEEMGAHTLDKCTAVVGMAAAWTVEILFDEGLLE